MVETGNLVADANSFVTRADVATYCDNRGYTWPGAATNADQDRAVVRAGDYLRNETRFQYRGALRSATQTMPWPREGASFHRGPAIPNTVVPQCVKDAQCELAYRTLSGTDLQPDATRGGAVKRRKTDVIETEYFEHAPTETTIRAVLGILAPVLLTEGAVYPEPYQSMPTVKTPYQPGEFDNPPSAYNSDPTSES